MTSSHLDITIFVCTRHWPTADELAQLTAVACEHQVCILPLCGSPRIDPRYVINAFAAGADGVLIGTCEAESTPDNRARYRFLQNALRNRGLDARRLRFDTICLGDGARLALLLADMQQCLRRLQAQPHPRARGE